ncbi:MAG: glycosyltransferase [Desulfobacca sp.]|uniref:glycosyltransferase n=1 Tax=Desulfobacca sp. TaxID=2067990 RepID=UPI0040490870
MRRLGLAYLVSEYPGISHTFIFREIQALRELGYVVHTASIRRPMHLEKMTPPEQAEAAQTLYIKDSSWWQVACAHGRLSWRRPWRYLKMLAAAIRASRRGPRNLLKCLAYFAEAGILLNWLQDRGISHVHVHFGNPAGTVVLIAAAYGTLDYSLSVHGPDIFFDVTLELLPDKIKGARFVRAISYYCQSQLMRLVPYEDWSRLAIVRCGVDLATFSPRPEPDNPLPEILCVGRLVPAKGQHILLAAAGRLKAAGYAFHLTLVGGGPDLASLQALGRELDLTSEVTFTGAVGQDQVQQYYDRADIFVLASFAEGVPVVLMEAMAKEIPCISTMITGIPELIDHGVDGLLVTPGHVEALVAALRLLLEDKDLRRRFGVQGRRKVAARYNLSDNCREMAGVFSRYLAPTQECP